MELCINIAIVIGIFSTVLVPWYLWGQSLKREEACKQRRRVLKERLRNVIHYDRFVVYHKAAISTDQLDVQFDIRHSTRAGDELKVTPNAVAAFVDLVVSLFTHPRTPHCPCTNCKIASIDDLA